MQSASWGHSLVWLSDWSLLEKIMDGEEEVMNSIVQADITLYKRELHCTIKKNAWALDPSDFPSLCGLGFLRREFLQHSCGQGPG